MAGTIDARLAELGLSLPPLAPPAGAYTGHVRIGATVYLAGQIARAADGAVMTGRLGEPGGPGLERDLEHGRAAAKLCALNLLAQLRDACGGDLDRVARIAKVTGFVSAAPGFTQHPAVINGASELLQAVFGAHGVHARAAVGASSLPLDSSVEVEAVVEVHP